MTPIKVCNKESFKIRGRGIVIFLQHIEAGLLSGWVLRSELSDQTWEVHSRVLHDHAINRHKIFDEESPSFVRMSFKTGSRLEDSIKRIEQEEAIGIYQYLIKPIGHDEKPEVNELLILEKE